MTPEQKAELKAIELVVDAINGMDPTIQRRILLSAAVFFGIENMKWLG